MNVYGYNYGIPYMVKGITSVMSDNRNTID